VKVLFSALHHAYFKNFESAIVELVARGHRVHLAAEEEEGLGGRQLAERLAAAHPGAVTWDFVPSLDEEPWFDAARRLRVGLDYVRALEPRYASSPKLRLRARGRAPRAVRWAAAVPGVGVSATRGALTRIERLLPASPRMQAYLRTHAPDEVVLVSLTYSRSMQLDQLKAARALGLPVTAAVMSWDHLSSKALLHMAPDQVLVWNDVQRREAVEMHGLPAERVIVTGAQCYDQWFTRSPSRDRAGFCRAMGLDPTRPSVLWVHSAFSPAIDPPEPDLVVRWLEALRGHADPALRELGVLIRPHPERVKEWDGVSLDRFERVVFQGRNPIDAAAKDDYFDALYHSAAVIGLATSAFLEAAIVGRPVLTITPAEYRIHQEAMVHFQYLRTVAGGLLDAAPDIPGHLVQLQDALTRPAGRDARNRRFLEAFVRPAGLDVAATPVFADAVERLASQGTVLVAGAEARHWLRPLVVAAAGRARAGVGRWLLLDERGDRVDDHRARKRELIEARARAQAESRAAKQRCFVRKARRARWLHRGSVALGFARRARYRIAVTGHRLLALVGIRRGELPDAGKR